MRFTLEIRIIHINQILIFYGHWTFHREKIIQTG